jgi:uncharacterized OsmC-like protein
MEVVIQHLGKVRFEARAGSHTLISDQPAANGGDDGGMTPPELLLAALGTCAGYYAAQYLSARSLSADGLEIRVTAKKAQQPARLGSFRIEVTAPVLDEKHQAGLDRAVKACLIHNTLLRTPEIETVVRTAQLANHS